MTTARIGIGALVGIVGGPATYARELVEALVHDGGHDYVVFTDRPDRFDGLGVRTVLVPLRHAHQQVTWDHMRLPGLIAAERVALYHGTKALLPWRLTVPGVVTVHDLAVYTHPATFAAVQRWHFRTGVPSSVRRAARVIAVSIHTRDDLERRLGVPRDKIAVVPNGVGDTHRVPVDAPSRRAFLAARGLGDRLVACVGTIQPRKRVERVIDAFVRADAAGQGWELVIAGRLRPGYTPAWIARPPAGVRWLGAVSDEDLRALYAVAGIVVSASEYEGFGLTTAEAMAAGCAVVAVGVSAVPEVVGDAGVLIARSDVGLLADALRALFADEGRRRALGALARDRMAGFTWRAAAAQTRQVYDEVLRCRG